MLSSIVYEEFERLMSSKGVDVTSLKRDGKTLVRTLETLKGLHRLVRDKLPQELPISPPEGFFWRKGTKKLWECLRDVDFRELCDAVMYKIDLPSSSVIGSPHAPPLAVGGVEGDKPKSTPLLSTTTRYISAPIGRVNVTPGSDLQGIDRIAMLVESQQASTTDLLQKLLTSQSEMLQHQTAQAQQLNVSLQALLGESERYFHEVVQVNQQLVNQLRELFTAAINGGTLPEGDGKDDKDDDERRAKRRKETPK